MTGAESDVDLEDTADCPVAPSCEGPDCSTTADLAVATFPSFAGVHCATLCAPCAGRGTLPPLRPLDILSRASRHAEHLGIDPDQMAALHDANGRR